MNIRIKQEFEVLRILKKFRLLTTIYCEMFKLKTLQLLKL